MIVHEYCIPYKTYSDVFTLKPIFDVHLGNSYCDKQAFISYLADSDDKTYFIGGGDIMDSIITKDIKRYQKHSDATEGDDIIDQQIKMAYELLLPYKDRIIGLGTGNHEDAITKYCATNPTRRLCELLDVKPLGYSWIVTLRFSRPSGGGRKLIIKGHHGWGGGSRTQGADLTKFSKDMNYWDADMFLYGHVHKRQSDKIDRLSVAGKQLLAKPKYLFICGSFLKTLSLTDEATYSEKAGYPPIAIGGLNIKVRPTRDWLEIEDDG